MKNNAIDIINSQDQRTNDSSVCTGLNVHFLMTLVVYFSSISSGVNALACVYYVDVVAVLKADIPEKTGARIINGLGSYCLLRTFLTNRKIINYNV